MPAYVVLINFTDQGARAVKLVAQRVREMQNAGPQPGVTLLGWYLTMGSYDAVAIAEAPDDETMATGLLRLGTEGTVRTSTMRAFPLEDFEDLIRPLP
jgi:uncharacterized protein with GYD domain